MQEVWHIGLNKHTARRSSKIFDARYLRYMDRSTDHKLNSAWSDLVAAIVCTVDLCHPFASLLLRSDGHALKPTYTNV
jgi:hypothetical protein